MAQFGSFADSILLNRIRLNGTVIIRVKRLSKVFTVDCLVPSGLDYVISIMCVWFGSHPQVW